MNNVEQTVAIVGALTIIFGGISAFYHWAVPFLRRIGHFLDDWFGEPARPGFPAQPGVMERLSRVEAEVASYRGEMTRVKDVLSSTGQEQIAMWKAIEAVALSSPPEMPPHDTDQQAQSGEESA